MCFNVVSLRSVTISIRFSCQQLIYKSESEFQTHFGPQMVAHELNLLLSGLMMDIPETELTTQEHQNALITLAK